MDEEKIIPVKPVLYLVAWFIVKLYLQYLSSKEHFITYIVVGETNDLPTIHIDGWEITR